MRTNKNLEVKSKAWKHLFFLCVLCALCGFIGCENHWMKEATAHMHRHGFEWVTDFSKSTPGVETIQILACTTGCNTTRGMRAVMPEGGIFTYEGGIITGGQPDEDGLLIIPARINGVSITGTKGSAFARNNNIIRVVIMDGVETIRASTFYYCRELTTVTIPDSVTSIGDNAFIGCESLTEIIIPVNVTTISSNAFASCTSLVSVEIRGAVETIGDYAFYRCSNLTSITIPESVTNIGYEAFRITGLTSVTFNRADTVIDWTSDYTFPGGASLREIYLAQGAGTYTRDGATWTKG